jgi:hypothetical protein
MSISFAATPQSKEAQQARTYTDPSAGAPPSRRSGYNAPYVDLGHWNKVFTDQNYFDSIAKQKGMTEGAKVSLHGDDYVYRQAMIGYLADTRKVPLDDMRSIFDAEKDGFAKTVLGKQTASAREMFDWQKGQFERSNEKKAAADQILQGVIRRSLEDALSGGDTPFVESVGKDINAAAEMFDDEEKSRLWEKAEELDMKIRASQDKFAPEARFIFDALQQSTGQKTGFGAPDMREMASRFAQLPDNQRKAIYELAGGFAQITQTDKGFWYQMAESLGRGASDIVERVPRNFREQTLRGQLRLLNSDQPVFRAAGVAGAEFSAAGNTPVFGATQGQMLTPEEREEAKAKIEADLGVLKVERELRDLAERVVDPIKTIGVLPEIIEEGLYGAARSIPYTAAAAVPIAGAPAVASALFSSNYDRIMLEYPDLDPDKAALLAAISAPIEAGLERMKVNTIMGRLPFFGGLVKRFQHPNQRNITRIAIGGAGVLAEQNAQEILQNATFPFVQMIGAALDEDIPDYNLDLASMPRDLAVQFVALLPLSLMGIGALSYREISRGENYLKSKADLGKAGYSEEQIDRITGAATADEAQSILREESKKRDPKLLKAAAQRIVDESIALREKANPAALPRLEKQGADYVVLSPEGKELARTTDQTAAEQALVSARRETVQREMRDVHNGINFAMDWIRRVSDARDRGEDITQLIREVSGRTLFTDYEANPSKDNLDRLFETARVFGGDPKEPEDLKMFPVIGSNQGALREGIWRSIIRINEGADGTIVMREFAQDNLKRALAENRVTMDWVRQQLNEILPQIESDRIQRRLRTETDTDVIEAFSDVALAYFRGQIREEQIPEGLRGFFRRMAIIVGDIFRRAYNLARLRAEGKLDRDFEALLAEAVGVDQQALVDRARERTEQEVGAQATAQTVQNYSITFADNKQRVTSYHLTNDPNFVLDKARKPQNNTTFGGDWPNAGIFVGPSAERWFNGYGYTRPFVVELSHPPVATMGGKAMPEGGYGGEMFIPAEEFDNVTIERVIPYDEYAREQFGEYGPIETYNETDAQGSALPPIVGAWGARDTASLQNYRYSGKDVREMSPEQQRALAERTEKYVRAVRPQQNYSIVRSVDHYRNDTRFDKLVKDGRVFTGVDVNDFTDMHILLHSPDNAFAGTIQLTDGGEIKGKGGVYYPALYADKNYFWASTEAMVMRTANHLNEIGAKNGGRILMGLVSAPVEKLFSSTSMATGVVKFLNALTADARAGLSKDDLNAMLIAASKVEVVKKTKDKPPVVKRFKTALKDGATYAQNLAKIDALLEPDNSVFQVRKAFVESLAEKVSKHLNANKDNAKYVAGILADAENKHAKNSIKRGTLSKASFLQGLGNMLTEPFLRDFQEHGNGKIYAIVEVQGEVKGIATTEHESYPATIVPVNKKSKVKLHVLKEAVDWQRVVGKDSGKYTTKKERLKLLPTSGMSSTSLKVLGVKAGSSANLLNYSILARYEGMPSVVVEGGRPYSPIVRDLLQRRAAGEDIPREVIDQAINENFPAQLVEVPRSVAELPDRATIDDAIDRGQRDKRVDVSTIEAGEKVAIRQDVPAMTRKGVGVVTVKSKAGNSYEAAVRITEPEFILNEKKSLRIAMGEAKGPHIVINGKWAADQSMPDDLETWTQVGYNPDRHSFYYDRATMQQVTGGSEAYQIGNTVFVKDAQYGDGQISDISYSISTQREIDRVGAALNRLERSPLDSLGYTEKIRQRFAQIMAENMVELQAMQQGGVAERTVLDEEGNPIGPQPDAAKTKATGAEMRRTKFLQALGELDGLLSVLPPQVAAKVGGYTVLTNIGTGDRALSNFFIKRLEMIDKELERYLKDRYTTALKELFKRAKPKRDDAGKVPKGKLGAGVHTLFERLEEAVEMSSVEIDGEIASLEQQIASGELEPEQEAASILLSDSLPLFGEWKTADASRMAQAVQMGYDIYRIAYKKQQAKAMLRKNLRDQERIDAKDASGAPDDTAPVRQQNKNEAEQLKSKTKGIVTNLLGFDQLMSLVFGRDSAFTKKWVNWQRKSDNAKDDEFNAVYDQWSKFLATLTKHKKPYSMKATYAGQDLSFAMSEPKYKIKHTNPFGEDVEFTFGQADLLDITMMWMQPKGRAHMIGKLDDYGDPIDDWSYDQTFVNKAEALLTDEAKAIRDFLLNDYAEQWSELNEVFVKLNDINLPQEQFYSPLSVNPVQTTQNQTVDPLTGFAVAVPNRTPPSLRSRGAAVAEPVFSNAINKWFAHRLQMAHWKAYAEFNNEALSVLGHRNVRNAIEAKVGQAGLTSLQSYLTYFQQGGNRAADANLELTKALSGILGRAITMSLFGRIGTVLIQFTQLGAAAAKMPLHAYLRRFAKLMTGQMGWGEALKSPYIQRRINQQPPQVQVAMAGLRANKPSQIREAARRVGWLLSGNDGLATAGTYAMVYDYQLEQMKKAGMTGAQAEAAAREEAERAVDEIAQPTRAGARSAFELSQTSPMQTVAWAFGSEPRKNVALLAYLQRAKQPLSEKGRALLYVLLINGVFGAILRTMLRDLRDDEDDEIFDWDDTWSPKRLALMVLTEPLYGVPVLGEMSEEAIFRAFREYRPEGSLYSVADPAFSLSRMPEHVSNLLEGEVDGRRLVKDINNILRGFGYAYPAAAGAAALSNLGKEVYEMADNVFGDDDE